MAYLLGSDIAILKDSGRTGSFRGTYIATATVFGYGLISYLTLGYRSGSTMKIPTIIDQVSPAFTKTSIKYELIG